MIDHIVSLQQFESLFLNNTPFLDVRSEGEFLKGNLPNSFNYPILNNLERHQVGTCYKQNGKESAIELGHKLVSGETKQNRIQQWRNLIDKNPDIHLFCWRGGMRSRIAQQWLLETGIHVPIIHGGYKALRRHLMQAIDNAASQLSLIRIGGRTGTAKTSLIKEISPSIDLEKHAEHRGSSFGSTINSQPTQSYFEHSFAIDLIRRTNCTADNKILFIEDESRTIGNIAIPEAFYQALRRSPLVLLEMPIEFRVQRILKEYIVDMQAAFEAKYLEKGFDLFSDYLQRSLFRIHKRLGLEQYRHLNELQTNALRIQRSTGDIEDHRAWIFLLLTHYYDPMYDYQIKKNQQPIIFRGSYEEVYAWAISLIK